MNEQQNGCAEPIRQALHRFGVPVELLDTVDRLVTNIGELREALEFEKTERPRTITLEYRPRVAFDDPRDARDDFDTGGHWSVHEAGGVQCALDARETLGLVAAMLLGAPHPPLLSSWGKERALSDARRKRRDAESAAESARASMAEMSAMHADMMTTWRKEHGSLPWELAHALYGELRAKLADPSALPKKPENGAAAFAVPLAELARRLNEEAQADHVEVPVRVDEHTAAAIDAAAADAGVTRDQAASVVASLGVRRLLDTPDEARAEADRAVQLVGRTATLQFHVAELGRFTLTGVPLSPTELGPSAVVATFEPTLGLVHDAKSAAIARAVAATTAGGEAIIRAMDEDFGQLDADRDEAAEQWADEQQEAELRELIGGLHDAGYKRTTAELREWPDNWRIDAQNYAIAHRAWVAEGHAMHGAAPRSAWLDREPPAPWFLTGEPEPIESLEDRAGEEHAGFGLEPITAEELPGADIVAPGYQREPEVAEGAMSQAIAGVPLLAFDVVVPSSVVKAAPPDMPF